MGNLEFLLTSHVSHRGTCNLFCASQVWLALLLLMLLPPCPRPCSLVVPHDPRAGYKVENKAGPLRQQWSLRRRPFGVIIELQDCNTHEIDGLITMEYHCVLFTVLLQLIIQPGRAAVIILCFYGLTLFPKLKDGLPESCSVKSMDVHLLRWEPALLNYYRSKTDYFLRIMYRPVASYYPGFIIKAV